MIMTEFIVIAFCYSLIRTEKGKESLFICCAFFSVLRMSNYYNGQADTEEYVLNKAVVNIKS